MNYDDLVEKLRSDRFVTINDFLFWGSRYFAFARTGIHATIINPSNVGQQCFQFNQDCSYRITRFVEKGRFLTASRYRNSLPKMRRLCRSEPLDRRPRSVEWIVRDSIKYTIENLMGFLVDLAGRTDKARIRHLIQKRMAQFNVLLDAVGK